MDKSNLPDACFNSTLVQLKDSFNIHIQGGQKRFNSTLVQLKAVPVFPSCRWFPSFNSTLVQLKGEDVQHS